jgi:hypothetical protein
VACALELQLARLAPIRLRIGVHTGVRHWHVGGPGRLGWSGWICGVSTAAASYKGRYPVEIINHCVWLYFRFPLSFREVEELCWPVV